MAELHPRKVRRLLLHFKRLKQEDLQPKMPEIKKTERPHMTDMPGPKQHSDIGDTIRKFKDDFQPMMPKIIVETKEKEALNLLNTRVKETDNKIDETKKELSKDEKRIYDLFSEVNNIESKVKEDEEWEEEQESINEEQEDKIEALADELKELKHRSPVIIKKEIIRPTLEVVKKIEPIMAKDKRVDTMQNSLAQMQDKLNQLIAIKVAEENEKMEAHKDKMKELDKTIKMFEMKLIKMQSKHSQRRLKPLIEKITALKNKFNEMALKYESRKNMNIEPIKFETIGELPESFPMMEAPRPMEQKHHIPNTLELPDITQEPDDMRIDLPEPVPQVPELEFTRPTPMKKKESVFDYLENEILKFIGAK
ncbi:MAG: hypothetical protein WC471_01670 [Candidatus Woesearchaeota archaeon]